MTPPRRVRRNKKAMTEQLIQQLLKGEHAPAEIATEVGMTLAELSDWARDDANARTLEGLARLADLRAQMLLSEHRRVRTHLLLLELQHEFLGCCWCGHAIAQRRYSQDVFRRSGGSCTARHWRSKDSIRSSCSEPHIPVPMARLC